MNPFPHRGSISEKIIYLLRYAILAPSAFNTQPWKFVVEGDTVFLTPDFSFWIKTADPEQRQLFISLGCAIENLMVAAGHFGLEGRSFWREKEFTFEIAFEKSESAGAAKGLFESIERRRTHTGDFERRPVGADCLQEVLQCVDHPDLTLFTYDDPRVIQFVDHLWFKCDIAQYANPDFRKEFYRLFQEGILDSWMLIEKLGRFSSSLLDPAAPAAFPLRGAPLFALLSARKSNPLIWIEVGRAFERIFLKSTSLGLRLKPICSFIAEANVRDELSSLLPEPNWIAIQPFSLGYAAVSKPLPKKKKSLESMLQVNEVLVG